MHAIEEIVQAASDRGSSDIHLICGLPPRCRTDGQIKGLFEECLDDKDCEQYAKELAGKKYERIEEIGKLDLAKTICGHRVRINLFRQQGHVSAALRILNDRIPSLEELGLPEIVSSFPKYRKGIVLVTG